MSKTIIDSPSELLAIVGNTLGPSAPLSITQERINQFADATGDHQWIHVDPERAATGPFGKTIAHGYLTLSLANCFLPELLEVIVKCVSVSNHLAFRVVIWCCIAGVASKLQRTSVHWIGC